MACVDFILCMEEVGQSKTQSLGSHEIFCAVGNRNQMCPDKTTFDKIFLLSLQNTYEIIFQFVDKYIPYQI